MASKIKTKLLAIGVGADNDSLADMATVELLHALEAPINGMPSIKGFNNYDAARRLVKAALLAVFTGNAQTDKMLEGAVGIAEFQEEKAKRLFAELSATSTGLDFERLRADHFVDLHTALLVRHIAVFDILKRAHSFFGGIGYTDNINAQADKLIEEMTAVIHNECTEQAYGDLAASGGIVGAP